MLKSILVSMVLIASVSSFAKGEKHAEKDAELKTACAEEIKVSGCGDKDLGKGLLKCMHAYRKDHKDMVVSESCSNLRKEFKAAHAKKAEVKPAVSKGAKE